MISPGRIVYLARRRLALGFRHWVAEAILQQRILDWKISADWPQATVPIHLLASRHDWRMALWMLASFHHFTKRRWPVVLHEDGSLGDEELEIFAGLFPHAKVWRHSESNEVMATKLARFPRCSAYRARMPHGIKCFDIPQLAERQKFLLFDPDVLFFGAPQEILRWCEEEGDETSWFNEDFQEPSPLSARQALADLGIELWPRVNSGLCLLQRNTVSDLARMETFLAHPSLQAKNVPWRVEQTLLALSASLAGRGGLLPPNYEVSPGNSRRPGGVARHYVGCVRDRFLAEGVFDLSKLLIP